jgi:hypothetical protein
MIDEGFVEDEAGLGLGPGCTPDARRVHPRSAGLAPARP